MANTRRAAREAAMKTLFQIDLGGMDPAAAFAAAAALEELDGEALAFSRALAEGALAHQTEIDARIGQLSRAWTVSRLAAVDRAILRLAAYEIMFRSDIPAAATINEAVELAKAYGAAESSRFVNGVLGSLARAVRGAELTADDDAADTCEDPGGRPAQHRDGSA